MFSGNTVTPTIQPQVIHPSTGNKFEITPKKYSEHS